MILNQSATSAQRYKNQVIYGLLHGQFGKDDVILEQARRLELDLTPPRAVILIDASEFVCAQATDSDQTTTKQTRSQFIIDSIVSFFHLPDDTICADLGNGEFAVLKASDTRNMGSWAMHNDMNPNEFAASSWTNLEAVKRAGNALMSRLRGDTGASISIGIGRYHPGLYGLSRSYQDAQVALRLGRQFNGHNRVYCLDSLGIAAFACVADEQTKIELATHLLSPLDNEPDLLDTLLTFFNLGCTPSAVAKQLSIHRNTLSYRLEKIALLTGLDPRCFDEAVQIRLALLLQDLKPS
ncbi:MULTISPECIES: helix-turn-helix domain-containing protein [unclassified Leptolyngbya]|uniref:PucR family transcriptional regulator n=1 Tax=unclassified Leptolyngbya TaxID=2650499 RepID=UPI001F5565B5|nr:MULTISPECIES: helix-turn-helix domain-containing protein [unclassified Leptolyngbya]